MKNITIRAIMIIFAIFLVFNILYHHVLVGIGLLWLCLLLGLVLDIRFPLP